MRFSVWTPLSCRLRRFQWAFGFFDPTNIEKQQKHVQKNPIYMCVTHSHAARLSHPHPVCSHYLILTTGTVPEPASGLGADLLDLYQRGEQCDITIQVAEQVFSCHR